MKKRILGIPFLVIIIFIIVGIGSVAASLLIGGGGATGNVNLQKALAGHWKLDGNAKDATPNSNHGTLNGDAAITVNDRKGQALKAATFDGTDDYISVLDSSALTIQGDLTLSAWIQTSSKPASDYRIIAAKTGSVSLWPGYEWGMNSSGSLAIWTSDGASGAWSDDSGYDLSDNTWHYVVARLTGTTMQFYVDGVAKGSFTKAIPGSNSVIFTIGTKSYTPHTRFWVGAIDDVRVYNRAITAAEITALYESYNPGIVVSDLQKGLVGHWKMDGNAKDATPNSNHGTLTGTTQTTDRKGQASKAYDFNGTTEYVQVASSALLSWDHTQARTWTAWIKMDVQSASSAWVIDKEYGGGTGAAQDSIFVNSTGLPLFSLSRGTSEGEACGATSSTAITTGVWYFLVGTHDGATCKIYIDTVERGSGTKSGTPLATASTTYIRIGARGNDTLYFDGKIDDVRVYKRVLTAVEITALYESYNPGIVVSDLQKGLMGQWKMDGNTKDATPQSNHGTAESITLNTADRKGHNSKAGSFNGTSNYVNVADSNSLDITGAITLSAWVNNTNVVGATLDGGIVWKSAPLYGLASHKTYELGFLDGDVHFQIGNGTNSETVSYIPWAEGSGSWHHITATWDGTTSSTAMNIYVDGVLKATDNSTTVASIRATADPLKIGGRSGGQAFEFFAGSIDDVRIYNRALSATEVTALYQSY